MEEKMNSTFNSIDTVGVSSKNSAHKAHSWENKIIIDADKLAGLFFYTLFTSRFVSLLLP